MENVIQILRAIGSLAEIVFAILAILVPVVFAFYKWFKGDMLHWVHVGLYDVVKNVATPDKKELIIRTLDNIELRKLLMGNPYAVLKVLWAARRARKTSSPVLEFAASEGWRIRNLCRGFVSSFSSDAWIAKAIGAQVSIGLFVLSLTREQTRNGDIRIGLVVIPKKTIQDKTIFLSGFGSDDKHDPRLSFLRAIQKDWLEQKPGEEALFKFLEVEMGVVC